MSMTVNGLSKSEKVKWMILASALIILLLIPESDIYSVPVKIFCMITLAGIYMMATDLIPLFMASIMMPIGYWLFGIVPATTAFGSWTGQVTWCVLGSLMIAQIMNKTGLGKRLAYLTLMLTRGNFYLMLAVFLVIGTVTSIFVTTAVARIALFGALVIGMCKTMNWGKDSRHAILLIMALSIGPSNMAANCWSTGSGMTILLAGTMESVGYPVTWVEWAIYNLVPCVIMMILQLSVIVLMYHNADGKNTNRYSSQETLEYIEREYVKLGNFSQQEIKALVIFTATLILLLTSQYNGLDAGRIFMLVVFLSYLPGIRLLDREDTDAINFSMVFMIAGCLAIGQVASELGIGSIITERIIQYLPASTVGICIIVFIICFLGNMMMTPMAMVGCLIEPLINIATIMGVNPVGLIMVFMNASAALLFPYETGSEMLLYSFNLVSMKNFIKCLAVRSLILFVGLFVCYIPWYMLVGIL